MKKVTLLLTSMLFSTVCFAGGKLSLQGNFHQAPKEVKPMVSLSVYEPIFKMAAVNSWFGYGQQAFEEQEDVEWFVAKAQLDLYIKDLTVAPGLQYKTLFDDYAKDDYMAYLRVDYKLW